MNYKCLKLEVVVIWIIVFNVLCMYCVVFGLLDVIGELYDLVLLFYKYRIFLYR